MRLVSLLRRGGALAFPRGTMATPDGGLILSRRVDPDGLPIGDDIQLYVPPGATGG